MLSAAPGGCSSLKVMAGLVDDGLHGWLYVLIWMLSVYHITIISFGTYLARHQNRYLLGPDTPPSASKDGPSAHSLTSSRASSRDAKRTLRATQEGMSAPEMQMGSCGGRRGDTDASPRPSLLAPRSTAPVQGTYQAKLRHSSTPRRRGAQIAP